MYSEICHDVAKNVSVKLSLPETKIRRNVDKTLRSLKFQIKVGPCQLSRCQYCKFVTIKKFSLWFTAIIVPKYLVCALKIYFCLYITFKIQIRVNIDDYSHELAFQAAK